MIDGSGWLIVGVVLVVVGNYGGWLVVIGEYILISYVYDFILNVFMRLRIQTHFIDLARKPVMHLLFPKGNT